MLADLGIKQGDLAVKKAGMLPYLTLVGGRGRGADRELDLHLLGRLVRRPFSRTGALTGSRFL